MFMSHPVYNVYGPQGFCSLSFLATTLLVLTVLPIVRHLATECNTGNIWNSLM
jgi:hypothetical protein